MSEKKYTGFETYLTTGKFTPEFIRDYEYWSKRIYYQWKKLQVDFETFYATCWEALLTKINEFDPNIATIQTFCISRINNEAWRYYMKYKGRKSEADVDSEVVKNTVEYSEAETLKSMGEFESWCNQYGVEVNVAELYSDYIEGVENAPVITYAWWKARYVEG